MHYSCDIFFEICQVEEEGEEGESRLGDRALVSASQTLHYHRHFCCIQATPH